MVEFDAPITESLTNKEDVISPDEPFQTDSAGGNTEAMSGKKDPSQNRSRQNQVYRKKKEESLEDKESKHAHGHSSESDGEEAEGGKAEGEGTHSQNLQSGATIVQFNSGGMVASLGSLMGLVNSSAALVRGEAISFLNTPLQTTGFNSLSTNANFVNQTKLFGDQEKGITQILGSGAEKYETSKGAQFTLDSGTLQVSHSASNLDGLLSTLLKGVSAQAGEGSNDDNSSPLTTIISSPPVGFSYVQAFNASTFFFQPSILFAFTDSSSSVEANSAKPYANIIGSYFTAAGLPISSAGYSIADTQDLPSGITTATSGNTESYQTIINEGLAGNQTLDLLTFTLTGSGAGNLVVDTNAPLSFFVTFQSGLTTLPVRIDVGPGNLLTDDSNIITTVSGTATGSLIQTQPDLNGGVADVGSLTSSSVIIIDSSTNSIVGNTVSYGNSIYDNTSLSLQPNVIYRHIGTSLTTVPTAAVYGNFEVGDITLLPGDPLTVGGNVLDVFGTKYGIGQLLTLNIPTESSSTNLTVTFGGNPYTGGNTLAGFGTAYGDFQTLNIVAPTTQGTSLATTNITFESNSLFVDKAVDSVLFPDIQNLTLNGAVSNLNITFENNIIQGNQGNNTFYSEIQNLGDLGNSQLYNGFITGVTINPNAPAQVVSIMDSNNNIITFGNDTYSDSGTSSGTTTVSNNIYNFTLLGNTASTPQPIMEGNALITDFNLKSDTLTFQLTPALFKALEGSNKTVTIADLGSAVSFHAVSPTSSTPDLVYPSVTGTVIDFAGGGSITLEGLDLTSFEGMDVTFDVYNSYQAITANNNYVQLTDNASLPSSVDAGTQEPLFGNGSTIAGYSAGASSNTLALDQFFNNSLFATYTTTGLPSGVTIDQYGNVTVGNTDAFLGNVTINATLSPNSQEISATTQETTTASSTVFMGFLDASEEIIQNGSTTVPVTGDNAPIIIKDTLSGATIIGDSSSLSVDFTQTLPSSYGGNLIIDTAGGSTVYGDYQTISFNVQPTDLSGTPQGQVITGDTIVFTGNALDVAGTAYALTDTFTLTVQGGQNLTIPLSGGTENDSGTFDSNVVIFHPQIIYGSGTLYGDMATFQINVNGGSNDTLTGATSLTSSATVNLSGNVTNNTFTFEPVQITVQGDEPGTVTTIYPNLANLDITLTSSVEKIISTQVITTTSAEFSGNSFIFDNATLTGGQGTTIFEDVNLNANTSSFAYTGFIDPVSVTMNTSGNLVTETIDGNHNSITWGNNVYTGGTGQNVYNFNVLDNANGVAASSVSAATYAVFTGEDTIKNFHLGTDVLTLNLEPSLYTTIQNLTGLGSVVLPGSSGYQAYQLQVAQALDNLKIATFSVTSSGTVINFGGMGENSLGSLTLDGVDISSFSQLESEYPQSLVINELPASNAPSPVVNTAASFDPVFINVSQPEAFASFVTVGDPSKLTYSVLSGTSLPSWLSLSSDGTLTVDTTGPVDATIDINIQNGTTDLTPKGLSVHIFANNASSITYDTSSGTFYSPNAGSFVSQAGARAYEVQAGAYEVQAGTVYGASTSAATTLNLSTLFQSNPNIPVIYGSQLIYDMSTVNHIIYGDVASIQDVANLTISGQSYTFNANLMDINIGTSGTDVIYGNAQSLTINAPTSTGNEFSSNHFTFGSNTVYGTGSIFGNIQTINLNGAAENGSITSNTFTFAGNNLTSGVYVNGSGSLTSSSTPTNLYASIKTLDITSNDLVTQQISDNRFIFGNSTLTAGGGPTNFYGDIADLSQSDFAQAITSSISGDDVVVTDANDNTIQFGNDTFVGNVGGGDTFNFTLLGSTSNQVVMEGNALIRNFNISNDKLVLQLTPALFAALDGADGNGFNKTITSGDLATAVTFNTPNSTTDPAYPTATGTVIDFNGGGSITLEGLDLTSFGGVNTTFTINYADNAMASITPSTIPLFGNGGQAQSNTLALDQFFTESLLATYKITGLPSSGVTIDQYGNINVNNSDAFLGNITITATSSPDSQDISTSQGSTATNTVFVGLLDAPEEIVSSSTVVGTNNSNIIVDNTGNATIIGSSLGNTSDGTISNADLNVQPTQNETYGGNLIIDTVGGSTVYGAFENITFTDESGSVNSVDDIFSGNAFDVAGSIYGITNTMTINVQNGANFSNNAFNFHPQILYGTGTLYGDMGTLQLDSQNSKITSNTFTFDGNKLTSGYYLNGSNTLTPGTTSNLYAGIGSLELIETGAASKQISSNHFIFGNSTLTAGGGPTNFYGDIADLSQSDFAQAITSSISGGDVVVTDANDNTIQFGNDTFVGNAGGGDTFNFTLLGSATNQAVMEGNALISNFNLSNDKLILQLTPALFEALEGNNKTVTIGDLATAVTFNTPNSTTDPAYPTVSGTVIDFDGGGSITLENLDLTSFSGINTTLFINYADNAMAPITPSTTPVFGNGGQAQSNTLALDQFFTESLLATYTTSGLPSGVTIDPYGNITVGNSNAFLGDVTITATSSPNSQDISTSQGSTATNTVLMGFLDAPEEIVSSTTVMGTHSSNIIEDTAANATIIGSPGNTSDGTINNADLDVQPTQSGTYGGNLIIDTAGGLTAYGAFENITFVDETSSITQTLNSTGNDTITFNGNALDINGTGFGVADSFQITVTGGSGLTDTNSTTDYANTAVSSNTYNFGHQYLYGSGTFYGDLDNLTISVNGGSNDTESGPGISASLNVQASFTGNVFNFGSNIIDMIGTGTNNALYAGINQLVFQEQAGTNDVGNVHATAVLSDNQFIFGDSTLTGGQGINNFYGDIADLSQTDFESAVSASTSGGYVQVFDGAENMIQFGNDVMNGSTATGAVNTFNLNLLAESNGNIVAEGNTTINNFGTPGSSSNMLDLQLSQALYTDISNANGGATTITESMLDSYLTSHNGSITQLNGNTVINFGDGSPTNPDDLGSITLTGITTDAAGSAINSFTDFGTNLEITVGDPTATIATTASPTTIYNVTVPGDTISSATQNTNIENISSLGHIIDFTGEVNLNMSTALFNAEGLSTSNTVAQNLQILENDAHTANGGIVVSTVTTGGVTNTVLTFESTVNGVVNTYGSVTLNNTTFNPLDPLTNHLLITHH